MYTKITNTKESILEYAKLKYKKRFKADYLTGSYETNINNIIRIIQRQPTYTKNI